MKVGDSRTITVTADPADASDADAVIKAVTWATDNKAIATVTNGEITAVAAGSATITATSGDFTGTVKVTVTAAE